MGDTLFTLRGLGGQLRHRAQCCGDVLVAAKLRLLVNDAAMVLDAALVSAAAEISWRNGLSLAATFEGEFSSRVASYAGKGTLHYAWQSSSPRGRLPPVSRAVASSETT
jgi:hypothetical protein